MSGAAYRSKTPTSCRERATKRPSGAHNDASKLE